MRIKICTKCKTEKPVTEFTRRPNRRDGYCSWCRMCYREYAKDRYINEPQVRQRIADRTKAQYEKIGPINRKLMLQYLRDNPCVDCGETHPATLEFDHVRGEKSRGVTTMITIYSWKAVLAEIDKCDVRCANCHAKKTAIERGYYTANGFDDLKNGEE